MLYKSTFIALMFFVFFLIGSHLQLNAQEARPIVEKIEVKGNDRISTATIRSALKIREGDMYDPQAVSQDVDGIWLLGFFDNIEVEVESFEDGIKLIFLVTERPVIRDIILIGNSEIRAKKIEDVLELKRGDYLKQYLQKLGEDRIRGLYREKGFHLVDVRSEEKRANGYVDIIYHINENLKVHVEDISFTGNNTFTNIRLSKIISTKKRKFPGFIFQGRFNKDKFDTDMEILKSFYASGGWLDADVNWKAQYSPDKSKMYIKVFVDEGDRYYVDTITLKGKYSLYKR